MCLNGDNLFVSGLTTPEIYQVEPAANTLSGQVSLTNVGKGISIITSMAASDGIVYALQHGPDALAQVFPAYQPVSLATPWGFTIDNINPGAESFIQLQGSDYFSGRGLVASPTEPRKLYISRPVSWMHSIISVKDYDFGKHWLGNSEYNGSNPATPLTDFPYPQRKPSNTFRILVLGESPVITGPTIIPGIKPGDPSFDELSWIKNSLKMFIFSKQLEFQLNIQAALQGKPHFEVLTLGLTGRPIGRWIFGKVPALVKDYDIDLVLVLAAESNFSEYYEQPLLPEGIPGGGWDMDPEYMLNPLESRIPPGTPAHFYNLCKQKGLVSDDKGTLHWDGSLNDLDPQDPEVRKDLMELTAKPYQAFEEKLQTIKTTDNKTPKCLFVFTPWRFWPSSDVSELFWNDLCRQNHFDMLDLSAPFYALKPSFYPANEPNLTQHYTAYGNSLIAYLLSYYLVDQRWIP